MRWVNPHFKALKFIILLAHSLSNTYTTFSHLVPSLSVSAMKEGRELADIQMKLLMMNCTLMWITFLPHKQITPHYGSPNFVHFNSIF